MILGGIFLGRVAVGPGQGSPPGGGEAAESLRHATVAETVLAQTFRRRRRRSSSSPAARHRAGHVLAQQQQPRSSPGSPAATRWATGGSCRVAARWVTHVLSASAPRASHRGIAVEHFHVLPGGGGRLAGTQAEVTHSAPPLSLSH